jgi:hypothetical protein
VKKSLFSSMLAVAAGISMVAAPLVRADEDQAATEKACDKVFSDARKLPEPTAKSIYEYGKRNVNNIGECLKQGVEAIQGKPAGSGKVVGQSAR